MTNITDGVHCPVQVLTRIRARSAGRSSAEVFERASGIPTRFQEQDLEQLRQFSEESAIMFEWINKAGYRADIPALRALHPELTTLETWARREWTLPAQ